MPPSNYGAALLSIGGDMQRKLLQGGLHTLGSQVPLGGTAIDVVFELCWPEKGPDIWALIKDKVSALIDDKIAASDFDKFEGALDGVKDNIHKYLTRDGKTEKAGCLTQALGELNDAWTECKRLGKLQKPHYRLPYLVTLGTLHLSMLRERVVQGPILFPDQSQDDSADALKELQDKITSYTAAVADDVAKAPEWRINLLTDPMFPGWKLMDIGLEISADGIANVKTGGNPFMMMGWVDNYPVQDSGIFNDIDSIRKLKSWYDQLLDVYRMPSYLWRYLDPECPDLPVKKTVMMTTDLFGRYSTDGWKTTWNAFYDSPQIGQPVTDLTIAGTTSVMGIEIACGGRKSEWRGCDTPIEEKRVYKLNPGERITEVRGRKLMTYLSFLTNQNRRFEAGDASANLSEDNPEWVSTAPGGTNARLIGISGFTSHDDLVGVYLHWQYDRWE